jgi:hypothetical protein
MRSTALTSKSQVQFIRDHLIDHGYITEVIARSYGVRRLASRIHDLRKELVHVTVEYRRDDMGVRYAYYALSTEVREFELALRARREVTRLVA